jgi:Predicted endonuclease distantly related to archaeal Holliday junction resolvase
MKMTAASTHKTGDMGETVACDYLVRHGYTVVLRNYRFNLDKHTRGEIDIIACDGKYIVFAEVKLRRADVELQQRYGRPSAAVTKSKQTRILAGMSCYLREFPCDLQPRADVLEITYEELAGGGASFEINHIRGAFTR